ncbi:EAL domain-containing protein [Paraburkholderia sp. C35]|uniref:putative bifunctional diguanylate cyclase/phosphodiesterase n=1 Tax=Paraburkholderia sp. C35 TaxID=2126993 RepID=UPI000D688E11|nr:EAL domain-containing protein [Paraburkholderia sp. C35]
MIRPQDFASFRPVPAMKAALSRSQFDAFSRQLPLLYVILVVNSLAVAATHVAVAPAWLAIWVPLAMCTACAIRLVVWVRRRKHLASLTDEQVASRLKTTVWLILLLGVIFTGWGLLLFPYGDPYARVHVAFYMSITVIGCIFCLMHMRKAALLLTVIVIAPFSLFFTLTHNAVLVAIAINMLLVAVAMIFILLTYYRDFADLVQSQHALQTKQTEMQRLSDENFRLANLDILTGLPNRRRFLADLDALFATAAAGGSQFAVGVIDLDGFKQVNDLYGHGAGDRVLEEVGRRLLDVSGPHVHLARLGGDEFGLLVTDVREPQALRDIGAAICETLRAPYAWPGATARLSGSLGFAIYPDAGRSPAQLFERADYALYFAKEHRRGCTTIFSAEHEKQIRELGQIEQALRHADLENEMTLHFQPIVDTMNGSIVSYEALARWTSPTLGDVPPSLFIKVAERSDFIHTVSAALLRKVLAAMHESDPAVRVAFNLSARDIGSAEAAANIAAIVRESGIAPDRLTFEVTETAVIQDFERASVSLDAFKRLGMHISLDDFGTGYSSLTCIHRLPLDKIKIDRSFLERIDTDTAAQDIVRSIVELCRSLKLTCVAEGVQTEAQMTVLRTLGCTVMQGFLFGVPLPFEEQSLAA